MNSNTISNSNSNSYSYSSNPIRTLDNNLVCLLFFEYIYVSLSQPLPGIEIGDIGPKLGYNSVDNGYAKFNKVKREREGRRNPIFIVLGD